MDRNKRNIARLVLEFGYDLLVIALFLFLVVMCSCRTIEVVKEVPVITEHITEHHSVDIVRDTLMMRDSVYHYVQGDTVIIEKWHQAISINKVVVADTVRDTIPRIVTVKETEIKEVNRLHWWQQSLMWTGGIGIVLFVFWAMVRRWR